MMQLILLAFAVINVLSAVFADTYIEEILSVAWATLFFVLYSHEVQEDAAK